jgi:TATA-binding protein-associated factor Taf7
MVYIDQQLKNVFLAHLLDFQLSFARAKLRATNDDIDLLKNKLLILLEDCYLIISLYKKQEDDKKENSNEDDNKKENSNEEDDKKENSNEDEETKENKSKKDNKRKELDRIREIEKTVASMELIGDSIKDMEEIYDQIIKVFKKYLFSQ